MDVISNLKSRWKQDWAKRPHLGGARAALEGALGMIEALPEERRELAKSGRLSQAGVDAEFREAAARDTVPALRRSLWELEKSANRLLQLEAELAPPAPDPTDLFGAAIRRECREYLRGLSLSDRMATVFGDATFTQAALEGPAALSGLTAEHRAHVVKAWVQEHHADKSAAIEEDHQALKVADVAVHVAIDTLRRVAGFEHNPHAFSHWMGEASSAVEAEIVAEKARQETLAPVVLPKPGYPFDHSWLDEIFSRHLPELYPAKPPISEAA